MKTNVYSCPTLERHFWLAPDDQTKLLVVSFQEQGTPFPSYFEFESGGYELDYNSWPGKEALFHARIGMQLAVREANPEAISFFDALLANAVQKALLEDSFWSNTDYPEAKNIHQHETD